MNQDAQKLTNALADPTRFNIYQYIAGCRNPVTVQHVAEEFSIHPNVARLHLSKLEDVNLLKSVSDKSGKGGRPSRLYSLSDQVVNLQFPPRDYQFLSEIAVEALVSMGESGQNALMQMGRKIGIEAAKRYIRENRLDPEMLGIEQSLEHIYRLVVAQGVNPDIQVLSEDKIRFRVYNCTFLEVAKRYPHSVCKMHNAMLSGIFETFYGDIEWKEEESIMDGCSACSYSVMRIRKRLA